MSNIPHLTRGVLPGFHGPYFGQESNLNYKHEERSPLLSELTFPFRYLKSVFAEDLFGMPHSDLCFKDEAPFSSKNLGGIPQTQKGYVR